MRCGIQVRDCASVMIKTMYEQRRNGSQNSTIISTPGLARKFGPVRVQLVRSISQKEPEKCAIAIRINYIRNGSLAFMSRQNETNYYGEKCRRVSRWQLLLVRYRSVYGYVRFTRISPLHCVPTRSWWVASVFYFQRKNRNDRSKNQPLYV